MYCYRNTYNRAASIVRCIVTPLLFGLNEDVRLIKVCIGVSSLKSLEQGVNVGGVQSICVVPSLPYSDIILLMSNT